MVTVQVAENDPADPGGVYTRALHRNQRRRTAVDKNRIGHPGEKEACLEASATSERISRTKKLKPYGVHWLTSATTAGRLGQGSAPENRHLALPRSTPTPTLPQDTGGGVRRIRGRPKHRRETPTALVLTKIWVKHAFHGLQVGISTACRILRTHGCKPFITNAQLKVSAVCHFDFGGNLIRTIARRSVKRPRKHERLIVGRSMPDNETSD